MRRLIAAAAAALIVVSCKAKESGGLLDVIHQTIDEARARPKVQIDIRTEKQNPSPGELQAQQDIEKRIEMEHVAHVVSDGSGPGYVRINVELDDKTAIDKLRAIVRDAGLSDRATVKVLQ
jgi:hypothetical protein